MNSSNGKLPEPISRTQRSKSQVSGERVSGQTGSGTFLEFVEAKAAFGAALQPQSATSNSKKSAFIKKEAKKDVKQLIDQLQVQRLSDEGALPGGKSIPNLPPEPTSWVPAVKLSQIRVGPR